MIENKNKNENNKIKIECINVTCYYTKLLECFKSTRNVKCR